MQGIDVETTALSPAEGRLRLVQIERAGKVQVYDLYADQAEAAIEDLSHAEELVAHNAPFERKWLKAHLGVDIGVIHDTMVMSQVLYTGTRATLGRNFSHSLASCVARELKQEMSKEQQQSNWDALVLSEDQLMYAAYDAYVLPHLAAKLLRRIDQAGLRQTYELELRVSHAVEAMQDRGVAVHTDRLDEMIEYATAEAARLKQELTDDWGINPGSGKQLIEYFELSNRKDWPRPPQAPLARIRTRCEC